MDSKEMVCPMCSERYADDLVPWRLDCGHALCSSCLDGTLSEEKVCPECHLKRSSSYSSSSSSEQKKEGDIEEERRGGRERLGAGKEENESSGGYPQHFETVTDLLNNLDIRFHPEKDSSSENSERMSDSIGCDSLHSLTSLRSMTLGNLTSRDRSVSDPKQTAQQISSSCRILNEKEATTNIRQTCLEKIKKKIKCFKEMKSNFYSMVFKSPETKLKGERRFRPESFTGFLDAYQKIRDIDKLWLVLTKLEVRLNLFFLLNDSDVSYALDDARRLYVAISQLIESKEFDVDQPTLGKTNNISANMNDNLQYESSWPESENKRRSDNSIRESDTTTRYCPDIDVGLIEVDDRVAVGLIRIEVITAMAEYKDRSQEELRLEHYSANHGLSQQSSLVTKYNPVTLTNWPGIPLSEEPVKSHPTRSTDAIIRNVSLAHFRDNWENEMTVKERENKSPGENLLEPHLTNCSRPHQVSFLTNGNQVSPGSQLGKTLMGTPIKYQPTTGSESTTANGVSTHIRVRIQVITGMKEYEDECFEELRLKDYTGDHNTSNKETLSTSHSHVKPTSQEREKLIVDNHIISPAGSEQSTLWTSSNPTTMKSHQHSVLREKAYFADGRRMQESSLLNGSEQITQTNHQGTTTSQAIVKYQPTRTTDIITSRNRCNVITIMEEYKDKSQEELRLEHYLAYLR